MPDAGQSVRLRFFEEFSYLRTRSAVGNSGAPVSTKNLILPEITRLEAVRSEVDVAICDLGVVTMGSFSVRCRTRPFEGR
jgi:hypothetical protein